MRVFVSSTFRDMKGEREELVKRIFPQLRKLCEQRGVTWAEIDLRWGINDEQRAEGKVLPICLEEIQRCSYFIGLLGERYGWLPEEIPAELMERQPWLRDHLTSSVTELEMLRGVLLSPAMAEHAFFYFRDPAYQDNLPAGTDPADLHRETPEHAERLRKLKERIRTSGFPVRESYRDPEELGQLVLGDFSELVQRLYPEGSQLTLRDRESMEQDFYAASQARAYIRRQPDFDVLDRHAAGTGPPLVVVGESGVGKSALLANWAVEYRSRHPQELVLAHFIGATPSSTDWSAMVRRLLGELGWAADADQTILDRPEALRLAFARTLHRAAAKGRVVLILDALNQLEDNQGAQDLRWLPPELPARVRLIVSTLPGKPMEEAIRRGWQTLTVSPLTVSERRRLIHDFLLLYTKELQPQQEERIAHRDQAGNPLYLRALLEELRLFGEYEGLEERISHYLRAATIPELYYRILSRYEQDYEADRPALVRDTMTMIWASRNGLAEGELRELLGRENAPLPPAVWAEFFVAAGSGLVGRSGLLGFSHPYLRQAVERKYLDGSSLRHSVHAELSRYFGGRPNSLRRADELPWQQAASEDREGLQATLSDLDLLTEICVHDSQGWWSQRLYEWASLWRLTAPAEPDKFYDEPLRRMLRMQGSRTQASVLADHISGLLSAMGRYRGAASLLRLSVDIAYSIGGPSSTKFIMAVNNLAIQYRELGEWQEARSLYRQAADALEASASSQPELLAAVLNNLAMVNLASGKPDEARRDAERSVEIRRERLGAAHPDFAISLDNLAAIHAALGMQPAAIEMQKQALETLRLERGTDSYDAATVHANLGRAYMDTGKYELAERSFQEAWRVYRQLLGPDAPVLGVVLHNLAALHQRRGNMREARLHYSEALRIAEAAHGESHPGVARILHGLAAVCVAEGKAEEARLHLVRACTIAEATLGERHPDALLFRKHLRSL